MSHATLVPTFLQQKGLRDVQDVRKKWGLNESQEIRAALPSGEQLRMRVRLCWRKGGERQSRSQRDISAAQLLAKISHGDWEGSIAEKVDRESEQGITHLLLVQREQSSIRFAALIPLDAVLPVWRAQRDASEQLIRNGMLGRRTKNHAMNGSSPTIYLHDDQAWTVSDALWSYPGVRDLALLDDWIDPATSDQRTNDLNRTTTERKGGGGFGSSGDNKEVEVAAVGRVRRRYETDGWTVRSVELERIGFDLLCERGGEQHHVEVKGVRGPTEAFMITAGEVARAEKDDRFRLVVVTSALSTQPVVGVYDGPAFLSRFSVAPTQFRASRRP